MTPTKTEMTIFETTDPEGRTIRLSSSTWEHIRRRHREVKSVRMIRTAVETPDYIIQNESRKTLSYVQTTSLKLYFTVHAGMDAAYESGKVTTAHIARDLPKGESIWLRRD